ncbi:MAG: asparaginase [Casimicrobiaceae bacterium]
MPAAPPIVAHHAPLAEVTRGAIVESLHAGSVAVVDRHGRVLCSAGDPHHLTFTRSALKPLQALPFVAAGGVEHFGLSSSKVALMCASHSGEPRHAEAAADILARAGCTPADLQCGTHAPRFYDMRGEVPPPPPYSPLQHNCSGKHSGMLAFCALCQWPTASYLEFDHPVQQAIRQSVSTFTGVAAAALVPGVDGCSAPNYAVPLSALARAFARLASATDDPDYGNAPRMLADAMVAHPEMVSGEGRSDLALMQAGRGDWVAKIGAEGVQALGVRSRGIGIAVKVADGQARGLLPSVVAVLDQLGLLDEPARGTLAPWGRRPIRNYRGTRVGEIRPAVLLEGPASGQRRDSEPETAGRLVNGAIAEL